MGSKLARWAAVLAVVALGALGAPAGAQTPASAPVPVLVVDGEGFGHGVGMAQDGAYWMGRSGASLPAILGHFYPGVQLGRGSGAVRVAVLTDDDASVVLTFPSGGEVRSPRSGAQQPGFPVAVPAGGSVRVRHDARYHVDRLDPVRAASVGPADVLPLPGPPPPPGTPTSSSTTTTTTRPSPLPTPSTTAPGPPPPSPTVDSDNSVWAVPAGDGTVGVPDRGARYRGVIEATAGSGPLRLVDELDVEQYLRGMGEVRDPSWPAASLQAQAVVARTYALRAMRTGGELCDTQRCQVYLGQQAEYAAMDRAVQATAGQVLVYRGTFAAAVYSANGGGVSASPSEGFGTSDTAYPYLRAAPYETHSPDPWQVRIALTDLARRVRYAGTLTDVRAASVGPSGRATGVALTGSSGEQVVPALQLARALGLRSTKWRVHVELGAAPPPPPEAERIQALPDDLPTAAASTSGSHRSTPRHRRVAAAATTSSSHDGPALALVGIAVLSVASVGFAHRRRRRGGMTAPPDRTAPNG